MGRRDSSRVPCRWRYCTPIEMCEHGSRRGERSDGSRQKPSQAGARCQTMASAVRPIATARVPRVSGWRHAPRASGRRRHRWREMSIPGTMPRWAGRRVASRRVGAAARDPTHCVGQHHGSRAQPARQREAGVRLVGIGAPGRAEVPGSDHHPEHEAAGAPEDVAMQARHVARFAARGCSQRPSLCAMACMLALLTAARQSPERFAGCRASEGNRGQPVVLGASR